MLRALVEAVEEIWVHAEVKGRLLAEPSPSMAGSGVSHLFERTARMKTTHDRGVKQATLSTETALDWISLVKDSAE
jgi:hypothetical protein